MSQILKLQISPRRYSLALAVLFFSSGIAICSQGLSFRFVQSAQAKNKNGEHSEKSLSAPQTSSSDAIAIGAFENRLFFRQYSDENESDRLSRIEKQIFGEVYSQDTADARLDRINGALPPIKPATVEAPPAGTSTNSNPTANP